MSLKYIYFKRLNFNTLNTVEILELQSIFEDKRANLMWQNRPVPLDILLVILSLREQVYHRFELIRIILMAIPETMDKINKTLTALTMRPFFKGQNNQKLHLSFCHSLVSYPTSSFILFTVLDSGFFCWVIHPQTFTVYQTLAISLLAVFFGEFFGFLVKTLLFAGWGDSFK